MSGKHAGLGAHRSSAVCVSAPAGVPRCPAHSGPCRFGGRISAGMPMRWILPSARIRRIRMRILPQRPSPCPAAPPAEARRRPKGIFLEMIYRSKGNRVLHHGTQRSGIRLWYRIFWEHPLVRSMEGVHPARRDLVPAPQHQCFVSPATCIAGTMDGDPRRRPRRAAAHTFSVRLALPRKTGN